MGLYGYGFLIGLALTVIFWFLFVAPMERRMHQRKMNMMKRKLARNEERLRKQAAEEQGQHDNEDDDGITEDSKD